MFEKRRSDATSVIIVNQQGQILFLHRDDIPSIPYPDYLDVMSGVVEDDESPFQCALRETEEESTIILNPSRLSAFRRYRWLDQTEHIFVYEKTVKLDTATVVPGEGQGLIWLSPHEIEDAKIMPRTKHAVLEYLFSEVL